MFGGTVKDPIAVPVAVDVVSEPALGVIVAPLKA